MGERERERGREERECPSRNCLTYISQIVHDSFILLQLLANEANCKEYRESGKLDVNFYQPKKCQKLLIY